GSAEYVLPWVNGRGNPHNRAGHFLPVAKYLERHIRRDTLHFDGKRCDRTLEFFEHLSALLVGLPDSCTRVCRCAFASYFQTGFASLDELPRLFGCLSYVPEM